MTTLVEAAVEPDIAFFETKDIGRFSNVMLKLAEDLGQQMLWDLLVWCNLIQAPRRPDKFDHIFGTHYKGMEIGISGLYNLDSARVDEVWMGWFGIYQECRNLGLGALVIDKLCEVARLYGFRRLYIYTDAVHSKAIGLYERMGFQFVSDVGNFVRDTNRPSDCLEDHSHVVYLKQL
jgi:GNAT superfamily N-acetyltransferase